YPVYPSNIAAGGLTGSGNIDLLVPLMNSSVAILSGNGDGTFSAQPDLIVDDVPGDIAIHDLNGDGNPDLAVTLLAGIDVVLGNGNGTFQTPQAFPTSLQDQRWDSPVTSNVRV